MLWLGQTWSNDKLNYLKWKFFEYQVVRYHQDLNFLCTQLFHLRKFKLTISTNSWISHKLYETICVNCGFSTTTSQKFFKCKNGLYIKCRFWWVEQYWYSWRFHSIPYLKFSGSNIRQNVELDECNKLCIHDFSIWDNLGFGQRVCSSRYIFLYDK